MLLHIIVIDLGQIPMLIFDQATIFVRQKQLFICKFITDLDKLIHCNIKRLQNIFQLFVQIRPPECAVLRPASLPLG